eukprot:7391876-Prymnesium_polylepis.6
MRAPRAPCRLWGAARAFLLAGAARAVELDGARSIWRRLPPAFADFSHLCDCDPCCSTRLLSLARCASLAALLTFGSSLLSSFFADVAAAPASALGSHRRLPRASGAGAGSSGTTGAGVMASIDVQGGG